MVKQSCTWSTVSFEDESVADFFEDSVADGLQPEQFARVWIHTHPGDSAEPSGTDEETFARVFGHTDWAVMFILSCGGETYARLRADGEDPWLLDTAVDFSSPFLGSQFGEWEEEFLENVTQEQSLQPFNNHWWFDDREVDDPSEDLLESEHGFEDLQLLSQTFEEEYYHDYVNRS